MKLIRKRILPLLLMALLLIAAAVAQPGSDKHPAKAPEAPAGQPDMAAMYLRSNRLLMFMLRVSLSLTS